MEQRGNARENVSEKELARLRADVKRLGKLEKEAERLREAYREQAKRTFDAKRHMMSERNDVIRLEPGTLPTLILRLTGRLEARRKKEIEEYREAEKQYLKAETEMSALGARRGEIDSLILHLRPSRERLEQLTSGRPDKEQAETEVPLSANAEDLQRELDALNACHHGLIKVMNAGASYRKSAEQAQKDLKRIILLQFGQNSKTPIRCDHVDVDREEIPRQRETAVQDWNWAAKGLEEFRRLAESVPAFVPDTVPVPPAFRDIVGRLQGAIPSGTEAAMFPYDAVRCLDDLLCHTLNVQCELSTLRAAVLRRRDRVRDALDPAVSHTLPAPGEA